MTNSTLVSLWVARAARRIGDAAPGGLELRTEIAVRLEGQELHSEVCRIPTSPA